MFVIKLQESQMGKIKHAPLTTVAGLDHIHRACNTTSVVRPALRKAYIRSDPKTTSHLSLSHTEKLI